MNKQRILAIVGMAGAGKSEAAAFFVTKHIPVLRFGDETDIGLREAGKPLTETNERWYREKLRRDFGMAAYAIKIKPRIDAALQKHDLVVLDGLYSWEEYTYLLEQYPDLTLLCVYAPSSVRYARLQSRRVRSLTPSEARTRDIAELEYLHKGGPIALADYLVVNESTLPNLHRLLTNVLREMCL